MIIPGVSDGPLGRSTCRLAYGRDAICARAILTLLPC